jgi:hypothetical protein
MWQGYLYAIIVSAASLLASITDACSAVREFAIGTRWFSIFI